ncbi:MAG TPA: type II toxin-antitoxin system RelE/ParE family toxin [Xanthobacteraceae bacterium]
MTKRILFDPAAIADLKGIAHDIAADNPRRAGTFVDELETRCTDLDQFPARGMLDPDAGDDIRRLVHGEYVIYYHFAGLDVTIMRILHGRRDRSHLGLKSPET